MCQILAAEAAHGPVTVDILTWINRTALDVIGLAGVFPYLFQSVLLITGRKSGFGYKFNALDAPGQDELSSAFHDLSGTDKLSVMQVLTTFIPALNIIVSEPSRVKPM